MALDNPVIAVLSCNGGIVTTADRPANRLLVATFKGVAVLERATPDAAWMPVAHALDDKHISALLYEPHSGLVFAGAHWNAGLFVSRDRGLTYEPCMNGITRPHIYTLAAQQRGGQTVLFCGAEPSALFRSDDLGESWHDLPGIWEVPETDKWAFPPPPHVAHVKHVSWPPADPTHLFVCIEQGALLVSRDDGRNWTENRGYADPDKDFFRHDNHRVLIQRNGRAMVMSGGEGVDVSHDGGANWTKVMTRHERIGYPDAMILDPRDEDVIYLAGPRAGPGLWPKAGTADPTVMVSRDFGASWTECRAGMPADLVGNIEAMGLHHHGDAVTLLAGTASGDVYVSEDGAASWSRLAGDLPPIAKNGHYRYFLDAEGRAEAEAMMRACGEDYV